MGNIIKFDRNHKPKPKKVSPAQQNHEAYLKELALSIVDSLLTKADKPNTARKDHD